MSSAASPPPAGDPLRCAIIGGCVGVGIVWVISRFLDASDLQMPLWIYGRFAAVFLFAWVGHLIGSGHGRVVAENIECLAIAVVMALVLKHFLIEAYKIPTGSMQPTIIGNDDSGIFDRVLVNKFAYLVDEPERFDVIVFKFPLNRSQNYIKRLIGLPGERVMVWNGDIYTAAKTTGGEYGPYHIARKPRSVRESVLKTIYPSRHENETFEGAFQTLAGSTRADGATITCSADTKFRYGGGQSILDRYLDGYDPSWGIPASSSNGTRNGSERVGDLALRFDVAPEAGCKEVRLTLFANSLEHRAILTVGGGARLESGRPTGDGDELGPVPGVATTTVAETKDTILTAGSSRHVAFFHVDHELILEVGGKTVLDWPYELEDALPVSENSVEAECRGGGARLENVVVQRDIHYLTNGPSNRLVFDVPDDSLFAMGDNTQNSSDGRMWRAETVKLADGRVITRERSQMSGSPDFVDIYGETWHLSRSDRDVVQEVPGTAYNFVPKKLLLGKALAVFWPIYPHFRWKLIH